MTRRQAKQTIALRTRISPDLDAELKALAKEQGRTVSDLARHLLDQGAQAEKRRARRTA